MYSAIRPTHTQGSACGKDGRTILTLSVGTVRARRARDRNLSLGRACRYNTWYGIHNGTVPGYGTGVRTMIRYRRPSILCCACSGLLCCRLELTYRSPSPSRAFPLQNAAQGSRDHGCGRHRRGKRLWCCGKRGARERKRAGKEGGGQDQGIFRRLRGRARRPRLGGAGTGGASEW